MAQPDLQPIKDPGGLFVRLGRLFAIVEDNRTWQITTAQGFTDNVLAQFENDPDNIHDLDFIPTFERGMDSKRSGRNSMQSFIADNAKKTTLETINAVDTLFQTGDATVLDALVRLMDDNTLFPDGAATLDRPTVAVGTSDPHPDNIGDGSILIDVNNLKGLQNPYIRAEDIDFVIRSKTSDDKGTFTKFGFPIRTDRNNYKWPGGSGSGKTIKVCDQTTAASAASVSAGSNVLSNSDFEKFTANLPDNWEVDTGAAGTDFGKLTGDHYEGNNALRFIGTAASIDPRIRQKFNDSTNGTIGNLKTNKKYAVHFFYRSKNAATQGTGNFEVRVKIGSEETSWTKALTDVWSITWTAASFFVNTPETITATGVNFALFVGVASGDDLTLNEEIYIDFMCVTECVEDGNLYLAAVNGTTDFAKEDRITVPITNSGVTGGGSDAKFQFYMDLVYDLYGKGLILPDAVVPNVPDSLIA